MEGRAMGSQNALMPPTMKGRQNQAGRRPRQQRATKRAACLRKRRAKRLA